MKSVSHKIQTKDKIQNLTFCGTLSLLGLYNLLLRCLLIIKLESVHTTVQSILAVLYKNIIITIEYEI